MQENPTLTIIAMISGTPQAIFEKLTHHCCIQEPVLQLGRKMLGLSDPASLTHSFGLHLTGGGVQAGSGSNGVTTTLSGQGGGSFKNGQLSDAHIQARPLRMLKLMSVNVLSASALLKMPILQQQFADFKLSTNAGREVSISVRPLLTSAEGNDFVRPTHVNQ